MRSIDVNYKPECIYAIDGAQYRDSYRHFKEISVKERKKIDLLRGHHFFGSHRYLRKGAVYFTMLREPHARLASLYNYLREIDLYKDINRSDMSLMDFLDSGLAMAADNGMSRMLTNNDFDTVRNGEVTLSLADEAITNLQNHFVAVGVLDHYQDSLEMFKSRLNWSHLPTFKIENKTTNRMLSTTDVVELMTLNPEYLKFIASDKVVYEYALNWFAKNNGKNSVS